MASKNPRRLAFEILSRVERGAFASPLLASRRLEGLDARDRALIHELVLGVLRNRNMLDHELERYLKTPAKPLDPRVRNLLRIGLYQVRFLDRIPTHAAVNETVGLAKEIGAEQAAGLANAVLRRAAREDASATMAGLPAGAEGLSVRYSHPRWLVERWVARWGFARAEAILRADNETPAVFFFPIPVNEGPNSTLDAMRRAGLVVQPAMPPPGCWQLMDGPASALKGFADKGAIYIMDRGAQWVAHLLRSESGMRVLDLCAAPGGKSLAAAAHMKHEGAVIANDVRLTRLRTLLAVCRSAGILIIHALVSDPSSAIPFRPGLMFDRVLLDAPCSGTGTLRRNPDLRWRIRRSEIKRLSDLQSRLLAECGPLVRPGGLLVYSTCSMEPEENEGVVEAFLRSSSGYGLLIPSLTDAIRDGPYFRTDPTMDLMDGFFAAVMMRY